MLKLIWRLLKTGIITEKSMFPDLDEHVLTLPKINIDAPCDGTTCGGCVSLCPTGAITVSGVDRGEAVVSLDLGSCIACGLCISNCPTKKFEKQLSTRVAAGSRKDLIITDRKDAQAQPYSSSNGKAGIFRQSLAIRVISTGCSACDMEVSAAGNPIFDMERFGVSVVASPRMADALLITGPAGKSMQTALLRTYEAMSEPRLVIACGTCAISGGVHKGGYTDSQGVDQILPVDVYIPGCPPSPWSIIHGIQLAMGKAPSPPGTTVSNNGESQAPDEALRLTNSPIH